MDHSNIELHIPNFYREKTFNKQKKIFITQLALLILSSVIAIAVLIVSVWFYTTSENIKAFVIFKCVYLASAVANFALIFINAFYRLRNAYTWISLITSIVFFLFTLAIFIEIEIKQPEWNFTIKK